MAEKIMSFGAKQSRSYIYPVDKLEFLLKYRYLPKLPPESKGIKGGFNDIPQKDYCLLYVDVVNYTSVM